MDITPSIVSTILLPLAISENHAPNPQPMAARSRTITQENPPRCSPITTTWRIDGGEPAYFRFFAIPDFARGRAPLQISVIVPLDQMVVDASLVHPLQLDRVFASAKTEMATLPLAKHLVQALSWWSSGYLGFEEVYSAMPYGSLIIVETLDRDFRQTRIHLSPSYELERQWLSVPEFGVQAGLDLHSVAHLVDWHDLELDRQLHESINLVRIPSRTGLLLMVYKAITEDVHYMYHELRVMLSMKPHPMVIARPRYVVVKKCRFGAKVGVCGFILDYHPYGTLQTALQAAGPEISLRQKLSWSQNLVSALVHVRDNGPGFYSDLKPNNVLLRPTTGEGLTAPLLIDFEQRGSWYGWSPPEVQYIEFLDILATKSASAGTRSRYSSLMQRCLPGWRDSGARPGSLAAVPEGYSLGWTALSPAGRQQAQVFGVGKLMWCIFEEQPSCNTFLSVETFAEGIDQRQRFPEFHKTPTRLRELIRRCTMTAPEWRDKGFPIGRRGTDLVPVDFLACASPDLEAGPGSIRRLAQQWWQQTVAAAEDYVERRHQDNHQDNHGAAAEGSPVDTNANRDGAPGVSTLEDIMELLVSFSVGVDAQGL